MRLVVVELAVFVLGRGPTCPLVLLFQNGRVLLPDQFGFGFAFLLKIFQILQEQQPGGLFGVIEFGGASGFFAEDVVNILECLFEHSSAE